MERKGHTGRLLTTLILFVIVLLAAVDPAGVVEHLRQQAFDRYQEARPRPYIDAGVRIVDIDDDSVAKFGQWPWPRDLIARMVAMLSEAKPAAIVFDMVFADADRTSPHDRPAAHDEMLADAIRAARVVVTGFIAGSDGAAQIPLVKTGLVFRDRGYLAEVRRYRGALGNVGVIEAAAAGNGGFSWWPDRDFVIRRLPALLHLGEGLFYPSLSVEAVRVAAADRGIRVREQEGLNPHLAGVDVGSLLIPTNQRGEIDLYFTAPVPERYIPAWKLLDSATSLDSLADRIVFIGTSASGLRDIVLTPAGHLIPGVEAHAQAVEQMRLGIYLHRVWWLPMAEALGALAIGALLLVVFSWLGTAGTLLAAGAAFATLWTISWAAFVAAGWLVDPVLPTIAVASAFILSMIVERARLERNRREEP